MKVKRNGLLRAISLLLMVAFIISNYTSIWGQSGNVTDSGSNRPYYEWMNKATAGLMRLQKIYVYANVGETVYFGSSTKTNLSVADVKSSLKSSFGYSVGNCNSACMAVTLPYDANTSESKVKKYTNTGVVNDFSKIEQSGYGDTNVYLIQRKTGETTGIINDYKQEAAGPSNINPEGYEAYSFVAPVSGVYTFRFFGSVTTATNPSPSKGNATFGSSGATVAAFDVTVVGDEGVEIKGREFTDVLVQNIGANNVNVKETLYVLTSDGFEYKVGFNSVDPWGFALFANKRGLLVSNSEDGQDDGVNYRSLLRSVYSRNNDLSDLKDMGVFINAVPQNPIDDESYYIFFDRADSDVIRWYTGQNMLTSSIKTSDSNISNFTFKGFNSGDANTSIEGLGGYFSFYYLPTEENSEEGVNPTSFEIVLDFTGCSNINEKYNYPANTKNEVILSNALVHGENRIYWDGKDAFGNTVPKSDTDYDVVSLYAKAGEVHFPLIDIEGNSGGIVVQMLNEKITDKQDDGYDVFYNNSKSNIYTYGNTIADNKDCSITPVNSKSGAMKFNSTKGNQTILDLWTNYRMQDSLWNGSIKITNLDDTCIEADTKWKYLYEDDSGNKHFDASSELPVTSDVELQYRIVDYNIGDEPVVDVSSLDWQHSDLDTWKKYEGNVLTNIYVKDGDSYRIAEKEISLSASSTNAYNPEINDNKSQYGYITIPNYQFTYNSSSNNNIYPYEYGEGKCLFYGLPTQVFEDGVAVDKYYQYRVVDRRIYHTEVDKVLQTYLHLQIFENERQYDIQLPNTNVLTKTFYQKEDLRYEYEPEMFKLPITQIWDDDNMTSEWKLKHRPKAVRVAILYGVNSTKSEDGIKWNRIQQISYMDLYVDGSCFDNNGNPYNLGELGIENKPYSGYCPVWKYTTTGYPFYYKIIPIGYSMDGEHFTSTEVLDYVLPDYYALESSEWVQYDAEHDMGGYGQLYNKWAKITDVPAMADLYFTKTSEDNQLIIGSSATYRLKDVNGLIMYFKRLGEGKYSYVGKVSENELDNLDYMAYTTLIATSEKNSKLTISNLPLESIWMEETGAPEGYFVDENPVIIHYIDYKDTNIKKNGYELYTLTVSHTDKENIVLPETGGSGTNKYIVYGLILICISLLGAYANKYRHRRMI